MSDDGADVAVVGGGSAGLSAAQVVAASGRRVVLVESARLGGECTWNGCVPSKSLIEAARHAHAIARAPRFGIDATGVIVDFPRVMARVRETIRRIAASIVFFLPLIAEKSAHRSRVRCRAP